MVSIGGMNLFVVGVTGFWKFPWSIFIAGSGLVPPSPCLTCDFGIPSGCSGVVSDPAFIDEQFRKAWLPFCRENRNAERETLNAEHRTTQNAERRTQNAKRRSRSKSRSKRNNINKSSKTATAATAAKAARTSRTARTASITKTKKYKNTHRHTFRKKNTLKDKSTQHRTVHTNKKNTTQHEQAHTSTKNTNTTHTQNIEKHKHQDTKHHEAPTSHLEAPRGTTKHNEAQDAQDAQAQAQAQAHVKTTPHKSIFAV